MAEETILSEVSDHTAERDPFETPSKAEQDKKLTHEWKEGTMIGDYKLVGEIGKGKQGKVFEAVDQTGQHVAIKLPTEEGLESFKDEIERAKRFGKLDSQFLKGYISDGMTANTVNLQEAVPYIVMELAKTGSLGDVLRNNHTFSYSEAGTIVAQIADALTAMHDEGYGHRDVKLDNVLVKDSSDDDEAQEEPETRLIDFGVADKFEVGLQKFMTTLSYSAPEELLKGDRLPQSDAYALGVLFYNLVSNEKLFTANSFGERIVLLRDTDAYKKYIDEKLKVIPDLLREPLQNVLTHDPSERTTAWDFAEQLNTGILVMRRQMERMTRSMQDPKRK